MPKFRIVGMNEHLLKYRIQKITLMPKPSLGLPKVNGLQLDPVIPGPLSLHVERAVCGGQPRALCKQITIIK